MEKQLDVVRNRFEHEAVDFDAIYRQDRGALHAWFNRNFRKPIFERYESTFQIVGDLTDKTVLDIGCGSGIYAVNFALQGARYVLGMDFSSQMIELARQRAKESQVEQATEFQQANFLEADIPQQFDFSIAMGVFDYLPDPATFLRKMKSVTRDKMIISMPGHSLIREPLRKLRYKLGTKGDVYFYSHTDIERFVERAGVTDYEIRPMTTGSGFVLVAKP